MMAVFIALLPVLAAFVVWLIPAANRDLAGRVACAGACAAFLCGLAALIRIDGSGAASVGYGSFSLPWIESLGIRLHLLIDGLNGPLLVMAALVYMTSLLADWQEGNKARLLALLFSETGTLSALMAKDGIVCVLAMVLAWAPLAASTAMSAQSPKTRKAARRMALHLSAASFLVLAGLLLLSSRHLVVHGRLTFGLDELIAVGAGSSGGALVLALTLVGAGSLAALFPLHTWLSEAAAEASGTISAVLCGAVTKVGLYLVLRLAMASSPGALASAGTALSILCIIGIAHSGLVAMSCRHDLKRLLAYTTEGVHGLCLLGFLSLEIRGVTGAFFLMTAHGLAITGLWIGLDFLDQRLPGWKPGRPGGLARRMPNLTGLFFLLTACLVGVPGLSIFVGEILVLTGAFDSYASFVHLSHRLGFSGPLLLTHPKLFTLLSFVTGLTIPLAIILAVYKTFLSPTTLEPERPLLDVKGRTMSALVLLAALGLLLGFWPNWTLGRMENPARGLIRGIASLHVAAVRDETPKKEAAPSHPDQKNARPFRKPFRKPSGRPTRARAASARIP